MQTRSITNPYYRTHYFLDYNRTPEWFEVRLDELQHLMSDSLTVGGRRRTSLTSILKLTVF